MPNTPGGSFIPKRSTGRVAPVRSGRRIYIFSYIAYVFFFGTLLSVVGIFFLNQQADKQLNDYIAQVDKEQQAFNRDQIDSIRELDNRIQTAEQILNWHAAPSIIFDELESVIVQTIQLKNFSFKRETGSGATLSFGGLTETFDILLFQRDVMEQSALLAAADIVDVSYGVEGTVTAGANRGSAPSATTVLAPGEASVTFTFENDSIIKGIGYTPRQERATQIESVTSEESAETDPESVTETIEE